MASASLSTISDILKVDYADAIHEQLNNKNSVLARFEKNFDLYDHKGKNFTVPTHITRNEGIGSRLSSGALPTAGSQGYKAAVFPDKYSYGVIKIDRAAIKASQSDAKAFTQALGSEMKGLLTDLKNDQNRQMFNDGLGTLATCVSASSATVTVDSTRNLRVGQAIDVCAISGGAESYGKLNTTVSSITSSTVFVAADAMSTAASVNSSFAVYPYGGHATDNSVGYEPYGLETIVAATDTVTNGLGVMAVASYPVWKSTVTTGVGTLTELAMQKMVDDIEAAGNGSPSVIITSAGVLRAYMELLSSQRMIVNSMALDGGVKSISFTTASGTLPIISDKYCPSGYMYFIDESNMVHLMLQDWAWADDDGEILKWVSGYDAYTAYMCKYSNVACYARNAHGKLTGITEA